MDNYFVTLNKINVNDRTEKKNGLTYLSWAWAWAEVKKLFPDANYTIYENGDGLIYHHDGNTAWVKTGVTVNGIEHIEYLPVMDHRNRSIPVSNITSFDVNKAIQRSLTKACARHGLGLYIYAGEDLPEDAPKPKAGATYTPNVYGEEGAKNAEWDELRMKIVSMADPKLCDEAARRKYGRRLTELNTDELREVLAAMEEKNGAVG